MVRTNVTGSASHVLGRFKKKNDFYSNMAELLFSTPVLLMYVLLFGATLKIADLLDEHGLKLFRGSALLFGILWGTFGALLILGNNLLANFFLALLIHWILRYRIDYLNHGIGASIMLLLFLYNLPHFTVDWLIFLVIFIMYSLHGLLNDMADRKEIGGIFAKYFRLNSHYFTIPIILTIINSAYWIVLAASALHVISYETIKIIAEKRGYT